MSDPARKLFVSQVFEHSPGSVTSDIFLLLQEKRRRGTPRVTLVLVGCLSWARVIPPPPNRGALMHLNGFEDLEQLVSSAGIVSFMELVDDILSWPETSAE